MNTLLARRYLSGASQTSKFGIWPLLTWELDTEQTQNTPGGSKNA